jgi:putative SOS response-associated peptidase YedK
MCGRITRHSLRRQYAEAMGWPADTSGKLWDIRYGPDPRASWNIPPGTSIDIMDTLEGNEQFHWIHWGYKAPYGNIPMAINARLETAASGRFFRHMFREGRVIVSANGWFEWTGEKGKKQPWYIRLKDGQPAFMAAITNWKPAQEQTKQVGVVIVTAAADGGLADVHDRRPVVLAPADARLWMDNSLPAEQADQLARAKCLPPEAFELYKVSPMVNRASEHDGPECVKPIA